LFRERFVIASRNGLLTMAVYGNVIGLDPGPLRRAGARFPATGGVGARDTAALAGGRGGEVDSLIVRLASGPAGGAG
jgi:hypothetical protein